MLISMNGKIVTLATGIELQFLKFNAGSLLDDMSTILYGVLRNFRSSWGLEIQQT